MYNKKGGKLPSILNELDRQLTPLHTKQSLADRWGVTRQTVNNWESRDAHFCEKLSGWVAGSGSYYPYYEVERYEKLRGLNK